VKRTNFDRSEMSSWRLNGLPFIWFAPFLALVTLLAWSVASPMGASPDDDFHLASTWCANASNTTACLPGSTSSSRIVPAAVHEAPCFSAKPTMSASCQTTGFTLDPEPTVETDRGNFSGAYPPVYYAVMSVFVSSDILASVLVMRAATVVLFVAMFSALFILLPISRRPALVWGWLITTIPLGIFLLASNNPSSWAMMGVGFAWIALLGFFESTGKRRIALGAIFALAAVLAAGSRGDSALYVIVAIGAVGILKVAATKKFWLDAILPTAMVVMAAFFFLTSRQSASGTQGFGGNGTPPGTGSAPQDSLSGFGLIAYNALNIHGLWAGVFGNWGIGWLDTSMPSLVTFGAVAVFVAIGFGGLAAVSKRKLVVVALLALVLWALPVYVLVQGGDTVGEAVQPRYILPLIILLGGLLMVTKSSQRIEFTRSQLVVVVGTLSVVQFVALHMNIRRYVTGIDGAGLNLNANLEWWWNIPFSPMMVWIGGSIAYALLVAILVREVSKQPSAPRSLSRASNGVAL
jgi:hypothetical protein